MLWRYKNAPENTSTTERITVAAILARFVNAHLGCVERRAGGSIDLVTTVPSTSGRVQHPLDQVVGRSRLLGPLQRPVLARGTGRGAHNLAADDVFITRLPVDGARVLLVDDTLTSSARLQCAASAVQLSGAQAVVAVVVGRVVDPDWNDACRAIWRWSKRRDFDFARCGWCENHDVPWSRPALSPGGDGGPGIR